MRIVVGMSGGVDSSVAALLLKQAGHEVIGIFMKNWEEKDEDGVCTATEDYEDVKRVCEVLDIPYYTVNFSKDYYDRVFEQFLEGYENGITPNPDVLCNSEIKFGDLLQYARTVVGADYLATGHYAAIEKDGNNYLLKKALDSNKDQTYFLSNLGQNELSHSLFPLANLTKDQVREIAEKNHLITSKKKDSTGICFIGERNFTNFLSNYIQSTPGKIVDLDTQDIKGEHMGLAFYTLGQRKGLGIGGGPGNGKPWYVCKKDTENNILYVVQGDDHPALYSKGLVSENMNWIQGKAPVEVGECFECSAKFRYRQKDQPVTVKVVNEEKIYVDFKKPQRAVTPGQQVVLYLDDICLGGGEIQSVEMIEESSR